MDMLKTNPYAGAQLEQMHLPRPLPQNKTVGRQGQIVTGNEQTEVVPKDSVRGQAGVREDLHARFRSLLQRLVVPVRAERQAYVPLRRSKGKKSEKPELHEEDSAFLAPIEDALSILTDDSTRHGQELLEGQHKRFNFQPIQRYQVLFEALQELEEKDMPSRKKNGIRRALNTMMSRLADQHPVELRRALQESDEIVATLEAMSDDMPTSVRDLRFLIGAKAKGNIDTPLSPLTVLKALIKNFGAAKCVQAMMSLRSRMMAGF
ncbi:hypothetical protein PMI40_02911 [Herbaspirillum sp. YR522]|nr:hypothetical protein PMI40_02911 [Herbaspirillum sp. YR522]